MAAHEAATPQALKQPPRSTIEIADDLYRGCAVLRAHAGTADRDLLAQAALEMESLALLLRLRLRRDAEQMPRAA